ncbi:MAG TPA: MMPL family transporter [Steroidobacteraceae bacterium]|nr:MMPL family transporter [Steroidobacteraceae bacterium]
MHATVRFFLGVLKARLWIAAAFALAAAAGILGAMHVPDDAAIDSLIVPSDPVARATREFERLFPEGESALLLIDAHSNAAAQPRAAELAARLAHIPGVAARPLPGAQLGIGIELDTHSPAERDRALAAIDAATAPYVSPHGPFIAIHRIGSPWINAWIEHATASAEARVMPLFGLFLMALILALYRSWRTLAAIVLTLGAIVAMALGLGALFGWSHTVVSALVPLTVMVTTTATLVYLHSRYIERDEGLSQGRESLAEHHARALANKLLPCTASMFATAVGFAALAVSDIRPIREMGLWTASGLAVAWLGCFLLFPALQSLFNTPLKAERAPAGRWYPGFIERWVPITRRYRWPLVLVTLFLSACGAAALFGVHGLIAPLALQTDSLGYIDPTLPIAKDTREFERRFGLGVLELWMRLPRGASATPATLEAIGRLAHALERDPRITSVDGPVTASGATDLRLTIHGRDGEFGSSETMSEYIERTYRAEQLAIPALRSIHGEVVGRGAVAARISLELVPTLVQSFALTAGVIFCVFLLVFRSASARLMAMIPSVFAILAAFLVMRSSGMALNIATILIGSTVLGATENDQVHFFYHFQEGGSGAGHTAEALRHAFRVAGRPIVFATLINAAGFLALAISPLPPMREFGIVSASAFLLALAADFTALPGALWILDRSRARVPRAQAGLTGTRPDG